MIVSDLSIKNKTSVFVLTGLIILMGLTAYFSLPRESAPSITIPIIIVATPYIGVSPADIENLVTQPIEKRLKELSDVKEITSTSSEGISTVVIEFETDVNIDNALQKVREKVDLARTEIPQDAEESSINEINLDNVPIMVVNVSGAHNLVTLKDIAEDLEDRIESVAGVLDVTLVGGLEREVQVDVDPNRLTYYNLGLEDIIETIREENLNLPGGSIKTSTLRYAVRVPGEFSNTQEIGDLVVEARNNQPIFIRDVATVRFGFKEATTYARFNGLPCVSLNVQKRTGENLIKIADAVNTLLDEERNRLPASVELTVLADQSKDVRRMVSDLENNIITGLILVVIVLFLFMGVRNAMFVAIAIPLSMLLSFIVLETMGYTLNMVVLFSLILALGMLVDNAIVIVENIYRHCEEGYSLVEAAMKGAGEVAVPVIASTLTTLCAFAPMLFWPGIIGEFMGYLPATLIITLSASLFVGLVINPTICSVLMTVNKKQQEQQWLQRFRFAYQHFLGWALDHRGRILATTFGLFLSMFVLYYFFGKGVEFFPETEPNQAFIDVNAAIGTRLDISDDIVRQVETSLAGIPGISLFTANVGSSPDPSDVRSSGGGTPHKSRIIVDFVERADRSQSSFTTVEMIRERTAGLVGARVELTTPSQGPPTEPPVKIEIVGDDFAVLGRLSKEITQRIQDIPGLVDLKDDYDSGKPELKRTAINGTEASEFRVGEDEYDIVVRFAEQSRGSFADLDRLHVMHEGILIPLANLATIKVVGGVGSIKRKDQERVVSIIGNVEGRLPSEVLKEIQGTMNGYQLPSGYVVRYVGENVEQDESQDFLTKAFVIALLMITLVLVTQFNSITMPFIIVMSVLLSLIGVLLGLMVTATPFGIIMTGIGVISLAGVVVNNAIVLIDYIRKLRERGLGRREAIIQGGVTRLRPVILTAMTTILGLIPLGTGFSVNFATLSFEIGGESSQWWGPMAVAVIFGLAVATVLTLVVLPVMFDVLTGLTERAGEEQTESVRKEAEVLVPPGSEPAPAG
ncbi:MAG TPA: efflux RND transporter permease subunit [candidate division Zixibacteria bacterium]|nr:efflux RND transporter permease subunit [candidate division Zixibacteria bacterium]